MKWERYDFMWNKNKESCYIFRNKLVQNSKWVCISIDSANQKGSHEVYGCNVQFLYRTGKICRMSREVGRIDRPCTLLKCQMLFLFPHEALFYWSCKTAVTQNSHFVTHTKNVFNVKNNVFILYEFPQT